MLEVGGRVTIEKLPAYYEPGVVINDAYGVNTMAPAVFCDVREKACIRLPHFSKGILFKSLTVFQAWVSCPLKVVMFDEPLDSTYTYGMGDETGA